MRVARISVPGRAQLLVYERCGDSLEFSIIFYDAVRHQSSAEYIWNYNDYDIVFFSMSWELGT